MFGRDKVSLMVAEFLSVGILTIAILVAPGRLGSSLLVALAGGLVFGAVNMLFGAHANPAVTVGLWTVRRIETTQAVVRVAMQLLGALAAWQLVEYLISNQLSNRAGEGFELRIMIAEAVGGLVLGLGIAAAINRAYNQERRAVVFGLAYTMAILVAALASNGLVNPAVALGAQSWNWAYTLGPVLGVVMGMAVHTILMAPVATSPSNSTAAKTTKKTTVSKKPARKTSKK